MLHPYLFNQISLDGYVTTYDVVLRFFHKHTLPSAPVLIVNSSLFRYFNNLPVRVLLRSYYTKAGNV